MRVVNDWPQKVQNKYGHLWHFLSPKKETSSEDQSIDASIKSDADSWDRFNWETCSDSDALDEQIEKWAMGSGTYD